MDKNFDSAQIEEKWSEFWHKEKLFAPLQSDNSNATDAESYCVVIPPPNVTGTLHMGHAFLNTIIDTLVRYQRMKGKNVLWQMGTDHAGIATQMVVERRLAAQGKDRREMGRDKFLEEVWQWKEISAGTIEKQLSRLGASVDWDTSRFTMDDEYCEAVIEAFVRLSDMGLIYRKKRLVNWDPVLQTAISDLEVRAEEEPSTLYYIRYHFVDKNVTTKGGDKFMTIATTRPETTLADGAVAVHPDDPRYKDVVGKTVMVPGTTRRIPVIADDYVKADFGSGCVKITPAHDHNDYEVGQRHEMEVINLFTPNAHLNDNAPQKYRGLDRFAARKKIIEDFRKDDLMAKEQAHTHSPPRGDRSGVVLEPYLTDQWFIKMDGLSEKAIEVVKGKKTKFISPMWEKVYYNWLNEIQDWCISRQLWWGHRIPAWYDEKNNIYVGRTEDEVRSKYKIAKTAKLSQDKDVLDTWFSSALWTFATMGWPEDSPRQRTFHPTSLLVTGFDIIFFWVARMIMMTLCLKEEIPFKEIYIHGLVRDAEGQKMSKSKGNILDPLDIIDGVSLDELVRKRTTDMMQPDKAQKIAAATKKHFPTGIDAHGTDALRFTFCAMATTGNDLNFDTSRCIGYRNFCNKLWNASRYLLLQSQYSDNPAESQKSSTTKIDKRLWREITAWMEWRFEIAAAKLTKGLDSYRIDLAAQSLYELIWYEYCDWYIEFSKPIFISANKEERGQINKDMLQILEKILRLAHPFIPFITEEIWQNIIPHLDERAATQEIKKSIMISSFPYSCADTNEKAEEDSKEHLAVQWLKEIVRAARTIKSENNIAPRKELDFWIITQDNAEHQYFSTHQDLIISLIHAKSLQISKEKNQEQDSAGIAHLAAKGEVFMPLSGYNAGQIDVQQNKESTERKIKSLEEEIAKLQAKLSNSNFINKAPSDIVAGVQEKLEEKEASLKKIK